jgi:NAD(P)H-hydrate repair Nnr-like enzyme with NAD(P)H-hydrate dehydratase domain
MSGKRGKIEMLLICGTIPQDNPALLTGEAIFDEGKLFVQGLEIPCTQGTAALVSAACATARQSGGKNPHVVLAGDTGHGRGSRLLYDDLIGHLADRSPDILLMHYILPVMGLMRKVCGAAARCKKMPVMIADASSMYAAKAAGLAPTFDIFTPDACELAFLADPDAVHPAYISHHLFGAETAQVPELVAAAYRQKSASKMLIVKGSTDYIVENGKITFTVSEPDLPALEAIGGTGDTISGMVGAMIDAGLPHGDAAVAALKANRLAGQIAKVTPATKIRRMVEVLPEALKNVLSFKRKDGI